MNHSTKTEHLYTLFLNEYPDVLTTKDLQTILGISSKTVFMLLHSGLLLSASIL